MPNRSQTYRVHVSGAFACFTRPELKTERVSYEVITPSAARGVLDAVLWRPAIHWFIERIHVLNAIRFVSFKRNEVASKASIRGDHARYFADEDREQRNSMVLKDVAYVVEASFALTQGAGPDDNMRKFEEMFERRLAKGQCFHMPYLGCREFSAQVETAPSSWVVDPSLAGRRDLGLVLHDLRFKNDGSGAAIPFFFNAVMVDGRIDVPEVPS